jgi:hypothetical protein
MAASEVEDTEVFPASDDESGSVWILQHPQEQAEAPTQTEPGTMVAPAATCQDLLGDGHSCHVRLPARVSHR